MTGGKELKELTKMVEQKNESMVNSGSESTGFGQGASAQKARDTSTGLDNPAGNKTAGNKTAESFGDGEQSLEKAKETGKTLLDQAKTAAGDAYGTVAEKAGSAIDEYKAELSDGLTGVAETVRRVGGTISEGETQNRVTDYAAKYSETAAQKLDGVAKYFEQSDFRGIARDVETYARNNPAIFLGGAFALGILAARFIKSSPQNSTDDAGSAAERQLSADGGRTNRGLEAMTGAI